jgi:hypothetical protein
MTLRLLEGAPASAILGLLLQVVPHSAHRVGGAIDHAGGAVKQQLQGFGASLPISAA